MCRDNIDSLVYRFPDIVPKPLFDNLVDDRRQNRFTPLFVKSRPTSVTAISDIDPGGDPIILTRCRITESIHPISNVKPK